MRTSLSECCTIVMGQSPDSVSYNSEGIGMPFYQGNADFGEVHPVTRIWCSKPLKIAKKGDILLSVRAPIGALNIADDESCIGRGLAAIRPKKEKCVNEYIYYYLQSIVTELVLKGTGSTFKAITRGVLDEIEFPVVSAAEQQRISNIFILIDRTIRDVKNQLLDLDLLVKSRFIEMFGDISTNTKGWNQVPLGELCDISRGGSPRPINNFLGGTVPWIKIGDATDGDNIYLTKTKEHIIEDGVKKSHLVKKGSLIFANCGVSLGFARIITFDGCIHDGWLAFENISASIDKRFLLLTLNMLTKYFRNIAPDGTQPNLNTSIMKKHKQIVPPLTLQKEFVQFVIQVDKSKFDGSNQEYIYLNWLKENLCRNILGK